MPPRVEMIETGSPDLDHSGSTRTSLPLRRGLAEIAWRKCQASPLYGHMQRKKLRFGEGFRVSLGTKRSQAAEMVLAPGDSEGDMENRHKGSDQWLFIVSGKGIAKINNRNYQLAPGVLVLIERGDRHEIRNNGQDLLRTLNIYVPPAYKKSGDPLPRGRAR